MIRIPFAFAIMALLTGSCIDQSHAQDARLKPGMDVVVLPVVARKAKEFSFNAGGTRNVSESLSQERGESWASAAMIFGYEPTQLLGRRCDGFVSDAPNFRFHYAAAALPDIRVTVTAEAAPFSVVLRTPRGHFICSYAKGLLINAALIWLLGPPAGQYDLWVGFMHPGETHKAAIALLTTDPKGDRRSR